MNICECGRVVHGSASLCKSCAKKAGWANGNYDGLREGSRTLHSGAAESLSTPRCDRFQAAPHTTIDNALRDAFMKVVGFDPLYDKKPAWFFPRQIDDGASDAP